MNNIHRHAVSACIALSLATAIGATFLDESRVKRDAYAMAHASPLSMRALANASPLVRSPTQLATGRTVASASVPQCPHDATRALRATADGRSEHASRCEPGNGALAAPKEVHTHAMT